MPYGCFVEFPHNLSGLAPTKYLSDELLSDASGVYQDGQSVMAKVMYTGRGGGRRGEGRGREEREGGTGGGRDRGKRKGGKEGEGREGKKRGRRELRRK